MRRRSRSTGLAFEQDDVRFAPGTFGALSATIRTLVDDGDEVIFLSPPWFFYESMIAVLGATPVRVTLRGPRYDLDADGPCGDYTAHPRRHRQLAAQSDRTRLRSAPAGCARGRPHAGVREPPPADRAPLRRVVQPHPVRRPCLHQSGGRVCAHLDSVHLRQELLAPGERLGYIAISPRIDGRTALRDAIRLSQIVGGWQIPNATLLRAVPDLERLSIDIGALERRRDRMAGALREMGYDVMLPEATFYMMVRSPIADERAFVDRLALHDVFVGPGEIFEMPGYFRISLTASDEMVTRALPAFAAAIQTS